MFAVLACVLIYLSTRADVTAAQNNPPFLPSTNPKLLVVYENAPVGTSIFQLTAQDPDGNTLTFSTDTEETAQLVSLTPARYNGNIWNVDLKLNKVLDWDSSPRTRDLYFKVSDNMYTIRISITMIIKDVNDNSPMFVNLPYRTSLNENLLPGTSVYSVAAKDPDSGPGGSVVYSMNASVATDQQEYSQTFSVDPNSGVITLLRPLDYETKSFYNFKVYAKDLGSPSCPGPNCNCNFPSDHCEADVVDLFFTVTDIEDTPTVFENLPYMGVVNENVPIGTTVLTVKAVDGDRGVAVPNLVYYNISGDTGFSSKFLINPATGDITVNGVLDVDQGDGLARAGIYLFTVTATELYNGPTPSDPTTYYRSTRGTITIMDIDDNVPSFNHPLYQATVQENTARGVPITISTSIEVVDFDQGANAVFRIKVLKNGAAYGDFDTIPAQGQRIQGRSTITIIVANSSVLDYETIKSITFQISAEAVDMSGKVTNTSQATVVLNILDTNDNSPEFPTQPNRFNVSEDVKPGYIVATIVATDRDSGDFGHVVFSLEDDSTDGKFNITSSGVLTVTSSLDREQRSSYSLAIVATDNPSQPESQRRRSRFLVYITVTDVNDNDPKWTQVIPFVSVLGSTQEGTPVTEIKATDLDEGLNAKIQYFIAPDTNGSKLFHVEDINGSAVIITNSSLIDNFGTRVLRVVAMDMGTPPRSASVDISIFVVDENQHASVLNQRALNLNQHAPVFIHPDQNLFNPMAGIVPEVSVLEEQNIGSLVTVLSATDADQGQNGVVNYYLVPTVNKDYQYFKLDRISGNLTSYMRLDREFQEVYEIQVRAEDNGQPAQLSTVLTMRVKLVDIDDNPPVYSAVTMPQMLSVKEENSTAVIGTILPAQDKDQSPYNVNCYRLYGGDSLTSLVLNSSTGRLSLKEKLDRETVQYLDIVIQALPCSTTFVKSELSSSSSPNSFSISPLPSAYNQSDDSLLWVRVEVEDINDSPPKFIDKTLLTAVLFDAEIGTEVMSLKTSVTDADIPKDNDNVFKILSVKPYFNISLPETSLKDFSMSETGSLRTNIRFRPDMVGYYGISVEAYDDNCHRETAEVKVFIVANSQRVRLVFNKQTSEVEMMKNDFVRQLSAILGIEVVIDKVVTHTLSDGTLDPTRTNVFIHGHDSVTMKIFDAAELTRVFENNPDVRNLMSQQGIAVAVNVSKFPSVFTDTLSQMADLKRNLDVLLEGITRLAQGQAPLDISVQTSALWSHVCPQPTRQDDEQPLSKWGE